MAVLAVLVMLGVGWLWLDRPAKLVRTGPTDLSPSVSVTSDACFQCHESNYNSWYRTYHRTMTREATPETVKGDFATATYQAYGVSSRMTRSGDDFFMETLDPVWAQRVTQANQRIEDFPAPSLRKFKVARLVGSHWFQECLYKDGMGRYVRLPISFHIVEKRWIHTNGVFLAPDTDDFWSKSTVWNESCVFCHNTKPSKEPRPSGAALPGYQTRVAELGIACEACHGPGGEHIRYYQEPSRRAALRRAGNAEATIINPRHLAVARANDICAHCHGGHVPRPEAWDRATVTDPFNAGMDLTRVNLFFWSEAEQVLLYKGQRPDPARPLRPTPSDGRFWGDGTPLTTALEYNGMALSACYENGQGKLSCLSCHSMHQSDPNFQLRRGMASNDACYQCHDSYRHRLAEHTHHPVNSSGSLCYNCHMPYQVYSLLTTHRSHRIAVPRIKDSLGTGKPHACNLCHLDQSLDWTQKRLGQWYAHRPEALAEEDQKYASSLVHLCQSDARTRAVVAGAFSWPPAQQAAGKDWAGIVLPRLLEKERYPAVRYLGHRGLRTLYDQAVEPYDYLALPAQRNTQLSMLKSRLEARCRPVAGNYPYLPLTKEGRVDDRALERLLRKRGDPDVIINE